MEGEAVAVEAEAGDDSLADGRQERLVAEWFARVDVADVDLNDGGRNGGNGIGNGDGGVGVAAGIEDDATTLFKAHLLQAVHNLPLDVALIDVDRVLRIALNQFLQVLVEGAVAIDLGLTLAHKVQVGTVDNVDNHITS